MSLIPSESLNFPDSFRASVGWHAPNKNRQHSPQRRALSHSKSESVNLQAATCEAIALSPAPQPVEAELKPIHDFELKPISRATFETLATSTAQPAAKQKKEAETPSPAAPAETLEIENKSAAPPENGEAVEVPPPPAAIPSQPPSSEEVLSRIFGLKEAWVAEAKAQSPSKELPKIEKIAPPAREREVKAKTPAKIRIVPRKLKPRDPLSEDSSETFFENDGPRGPIDPLFEGTVRKPDTETVRPSGGPRKIPTKRLEPIRPGPQFYVKGDSRAWWHRFLLVEIGALIVFLALLRVGIVHRFIDPTVTIMMDILIAVAAVAVMGLPVIFWRNSPARWRSKR